MQKSYIKYILALLLYGSNGLIISTIDLSSYEIVFLRSVIGSALLLVFFFVTGHRLTIFKHRRDFFFVAASGVSMAATWLFLFESYTKIGVSLGVLINYFGPAIVVAASPLIFKEQLTPAKIAAFLVALLGVFLISGRAAIEGINFWGLFCAVMSAIAYAALVITNKLSREVCGMENAVVQLFFTALTVTVFLVLKQGFVVTIPEGDLLPVLWLGIVNTGIACYLCFSSIGKLPVQSVAVCGYFEPLSAVLLSAIFLHEALLPLQALGAALIIGGALFGELYKSKPHIH